MDTKVNGKAVAASSAAMHDGAERHPLETAFQPRTVAVIGASDAPGSTGRRLLWNLMSSPFGGTVYPVNPNRASVLGVRSYRRIQDVPEQVELALVATPAEAVPQVIADCVEAGVATAVVVSSGFREAGAAGAELERQIAEAMRGSRMRLIGPNSAGIMNPRTGLNASVAPMIARPGRVALVSQSGALAAAVLDWCQRETVGFSAVVVLGSMLDVSWGDLIDYLGEDSRTQSIVCYMESIGDARRFLSAAREVSLTKPIIVVKAGRSAVGARAAATHTGAMVSSTEVLEAAFRRCGVLRVDSISDLFYMAEVLAKQPRPRGNRLLILTNSGGPGVLAADTYSALGGELPELSEASLQALNEVMPDNWSHSNPVDILGDADPQRFQRALEIATNDAGYDGLLVVTAPQALFPLIGMAERLAAYATSTGRPLLASFMGAASAKAANNLLARANIPTFPYPDMAARAFHSMWRYTYNLRGLYETPTLPQAADPDREATREMIAAARGARRQLLTEYESKQLLAAYRIPIVETRAAASEDEAVAAAEAIGFPVAVKLHSATVAHKTEVGGVQLELRDAAAVAAAWRAIRTSVERQMGDGHFQGVTVQPMIALEGGYELIVGSAIDPQFGPVLLFGSGGRLAEVYRDRSLALPPLNTTLARRMMEQTKIYTALKGVRGRRPVALGALEELLVRFSQMVIEQPWIREVDINPLLATPDGLIALDARVALHGPEVGEAELLRPAIRPYPIQYVSDWTLKNGMAAVIRPIRPEDEPLMVGFHQKLSDRTVYLRYFQPLKLSQRVAHERLTRICFIDYDREMALAAVVEREGQPEIIAVGRLSRLHGVNEAECAVLVRDDFQHLGIGTELYRRILAVARAEKIHRVVSTMMVENREMRAICQKLGFTVTIDMEDQMARAEMITG